MLLKRRAAAADEADADALDDERLARGIDDDGRERRVLGDELDDAPLAAQALDGDLVTEARDWVWVPPDAYEDVNDAYRLTHYPERSSVQWSKADGPAGPLIDKVERLARDAERPVLRWWVDDATRPAHTEQELSERGYEHVESVDVLAREIGPEEMANGVTLARYFLNEALRIASAEGDPDLLLAEKTLAWIQRTNKPVVALSALYRGGPVEIRKAAVARKIATLLLEHGYLSVIEGGAQIDGKVCEAYQVL